MKRSRDIHVLIGLGIFAVVAVLLYWLAWFLAPRYPRQWPLHLFQGASHLKSNPHARDGSLPVRIIGS